MSHSRNSLQRKLVRGIWFAAAPFLFLNLLPALFLARPLLTWPLSLALGLVVALFLIPNLQKHIPFDLDQLFSSTLAHSVLICLLLALLSLSFPAMKMIFAPGVAQAKEMSLFVLFIAVLTVRPVLGLIQTGMNRLVLSDRTDYQALLCDISGRIAASLYLPDLLQVLTAELPDRLMLTAVGLMIMDENKSRLYPEDLRFGTGLWVDSRLVRLLREGNHFFFCKPVPEDPQLSRELAEIRQAGFSLVYGLQGGSQFNGMLLLGDRTDNVLHSRTDVQVFSTLANQVNIAVENALNYESLAESNDHLQMVYDKLVQAEKMAALGELTTVLAHELKNPLGIIRGSAQFLATAPRSHEMQQELLHYIVDEVDNLNLVIGNLLGLARHKPPRFRQVDLHRELSTFICRWQQSSEHNPLVEIILALPEHLPIIYADSRQLRQVLLNCIANSEEVMPAGGVIKIAARKIEKERIEIVLTDTGPGMAEEDLKLVFKKFFTTKEKGVGLGLPVCRQIIRAHNGSIRLMNRSSGGVQVVIRLPLRPLGTIGQGGAPFAPDENKTIMGRIWSSEY